MIGLFTIAGLGVCARAFRLAAPSKPGSLRHNTIAVADFMLSAVRFLHLPKVVPMLPLAWYSWYDSGVVILSTNKQGTGVERQLQL